MTPLNRTTIQWLTLWLLGLVGTAASAAPASDTPTTAPTGERVAEVISVYSPLAEQREFARRAMLPSTFDRLTRFEAAGKAELKPYVLDLSKELLDAYIPKHRPPNGYGVFVFIPPTPEWRVPKSYVATLEARGIIWVAARKSGNQQNVYDRRMPLALHALAWVAAHYPVDPTRRYISGFSGGGRVAQRVALAYPDVFSGAMLIAGSDPFNENATVIPPADLFQQFQRHMRIAYVTGANDLVNRAHDQRTRASMQAYCVSHLFKHVQSRTEHWIPSGRGFARALADIDSVSATPSDQLACEAALNASVAASKAAIRQLIDTHQDHRAGEALAALEDRFGGLAAPESVLWARELAARLTAEAGGNRQ
ncbi:hypothetical protein C7S18_00555 [Ahniella affigens]|uniref:Alpha/beta hydrolase n=1 Tax=Ahniella affigens TaxID=2021234 RepID=A0A2P1PLQ3_9GAMM|nr:PHB depolymerase family esterase [Ahniella affigens]AVP95777.1 hypothetical protein C7S18_00555 [Ahniella affigens]